MRNWRQVHGSAAAEYYIETGKPSSAPLGAMGKGLEAANNVKADMRWGVAAERKPLEAVARPLAAAD